MKYDDSQSVIVRTITRTFAYGADSTHFSTHSLSLPGGAGTKSCQPLAVSDWQRSTTVPILAHEASTDRQPDKEHTVAHPSAGLGSSKGCGLHDERFPAARASYDQALAESSSRVRAKMWVTA
jgi:hypothetical protein